MQQERQRNLVQSITHISIFVIVGSVQGIISGIIQDPNWGPFFFLSPLIGLLDGVYLSWFYKSEKTDANLFIRLSIGITVGMFFGLLLGSFLGGVLGTIVSFLFPSSFFTPIFLTGTGIGMLLLGARLPIFIANLIPAKHLE